MFVSVTSLILHSYCLFLTIAFVFFVNLGHYQIALFPNHYFQSSKCFAPIQQVPAQTVASVVQAPFRLDTVCAQTFVIAGVFMRAVKVRWQHCVCVFVCVCVCVCVCV